MIWLRPRFDERVVHVVWRQALRHEPVAPDIYGIQLPGGLKPVSYGTEISIVQEGVPEVIPTEMCYLGWQESLAQLAKLVEPNIPDWRCKPWRFGDRAGSGEPHNPGSSSTHWPTYVLRLLLPAGNGMSHAVARLRAVRMAHRDEPFIARGSRAPRCPGCRVIFSHCLCALRPQVPTRSGMCLIMCDIEPLKPSNTGWLIADVVNDTAAFGWSRTEVDPALLALLADPQWAPYLVFPGEFVAPERVVTEVPVIPGKRPLFVLLDATWPEARKMFRKSPYLNHLPVLSLQPEQLSRYRLRRSTRDDHLCTSEVAALCLALAGEQHAGETLETYLEVFTHHYLNAKQSVPPDLEDAAHQRLRALAKLATKVDRPKF